MVYAMEFFNQVQADDRYHEHRVNAVTVEPPSEAEPGKVTRRVVKASPSGRSKTMTQLPTLGSLGKKGSTRKLKDAVTKLMSDKKLVKR